MDDIIDSRHERLGKAIRARRDEQGISQRKLAQMIGQGNSNSYVYRVEQGRVRLSFEQIMKIADALDIEVGKLIDF